MVAGFLIVAVVLGGGGSPAPLPELILELLAVLFVFVCLFIPLKGLEWNRISKATWTIVALTVVVPLLQLIPLPPLIWRALPSRELEVQALTLIGEENSWRTWSMAPSRTLASLLSLAPPLLVLLVTSALRRSGLMLLMRSMVAVLGGILIIGALQVTAGEASLIHFYGSTEQWLFGFQANHNSAADVVMITMLAVPVILRDSIERRNFQASPVILIMSLCFFSALLILVVVLTASRMGVALLPIPIFATIWILGPWIFTSSRSTLYGILGIGLIGIVGLSLAKQNPTIQGILVRFDFSEELRPQLWRDAVYVAQKYFPFGVGMGDFVPAFVADEPLDVIRPSLPNRAHNDYLELTSEAGLPGLLALFAISVILGRVLWKKLRGCLGRPAALTIFAGAGLSVLALHSLVDYPFRSMSLACLGAVCAGLLLSSSNDIGLAQKRTSQTQ